MWDGQALKHFRNDNRSLVTDLRGVLTTVGEVWREWSLRG
jgi:hypothetical protein